MLPSSCASCAASSSSSRSTSAFSPRCQDLDLACQLSAGSGALCVIDRVRQQPAAARSRPPARPACPAAPARSAAACWSCCGLLRLELQHAVGDPLLGLQLGGFLLSQSLTLVSGAQVGDRLLLRGLQLLGVAPQLAQQLQLGVEGGGQIVHLLQTQRPAPCPPGQPLPACAPRPAAHATNGPHLRAAARPRLPRDRPRSRLLLRRPGRWPALPPLARSRVWPARSGPRPASGATGLPAACRAASCDAEALLRAGGPAPRCRRTCRSPARRPGLHARPLRSPCCAAPAPRARRPAGAAGWPGPHGCG